MDVLNLKAPGGEYIMEIEGLGNPLFFMHTQVEKMTEPEFYKWLCELLFFGLRQKDKQQAFLEFSYKYPHCVRTDFIFELEILTYELFQKLRPEIEKHVDVKAYADEADKRNKEGWGR